MIAHAELHEAMRRFMPSQRWFGASTDQLTEISIAGTETMKAEFPAILRVEVDTFLIDGRKERYQFLMGLRAPSDRIPLADEGQKAAVGEFMTELGPAYGYDALCDPELSLKLFELISPDGASPRHVRPMAAEQTNTSLIFDERLVLKIFRKLSWDASLELEMISALDEVGFHHVAQLVAEWRNEAFDLGFIQVFLSDGVEGRAMAITSLRDYFSQGGDPSQAGGDFSGEAERLGEMTANMHVALAKAFGSQPGNAEEWAELMQRQLLRVRHSGLDPGAAERVFERLRSVSDPGPSQRVHGDFHLGQVLRTDSGWFVFDFEGEPARPEDERRTAMSPLKDVAGMLRSLQYAARAVMAEQLQSDPENFAAGWEDRNRQAFLEGYVAVAHEAGNILPGDTESLEIVLKAFELDKAVYEIGYEMAHRPDWVNIPLAALPGLLD